MFPLRLDWAVDWSQFRNLDGDLGWKADPLVAEAWGAPVLDHPAPAGGRDRATVHLVTRAMALAPGHITLAAPTQPMAIVTGGYVTDGVSIATTGRVLARGAPATLVVRPLPPSPADFTGAVGQFTLRTTVDKASVNGGAPIRWTLTARGDWQLAGLLRRARPGRWIAPSRLPANRSSIRRRTRRCSTAPLARR